MNRCCNDCLCTSTGMQRI